MNTHKKLITHKARFFRLSMPVSVLAIITFLATAGVLLMSTPAVTDATGTSCQPTGTTYGTDSIPVSVQVATTYNIWVRMQTPTASDNSIFLQVDPPQASPPTVGPCFTVGGTSLTPNSWTWVNYENGSTSQVMQVALTAGSHTLYLIGTEPGVEIDNVLLLANAGCVPSGTGTNCTTNQPVPTTPTLSAKAASSTTVDLSWTQSSDSNGLSVAGYYVFRNGTQIAKITSPTTLTYTDTVTAGTTNTYTVEAYDNSSPPVTSTLSNAVPVTPGLTAPTGVTAAADGPNQVNVSWQASTDAGGPGLGGYYILRNGDNIASVSATTTGYEDKTVSADTAYSYTIEAFDTNVPPDASSPSTAATVTTPQPTPAPQPPDNVSATAQAYNSVVVTWGASTDPGGPGVAGYYIIRNGTTIAQVLSPTLKYVDNAVVANTKYTYTVEAYDTATPPNVSGPSNSSTTTTPSAPDTQPPTAPTLSAQAVSTSQINLSWSGSTDNVGVAGYLIYRNGNEIANDTTPGGSGSYGDTGLSANTSYTYYVIAYDAAQNKSPHSNSVTLSTQANATTVTVEGKVTNASTKAALAGVDVHTGIHGTKEGAATSTTNSAGEYVLSNITPNHVHDYNFHDTGFKGVGFQKAFPASTVTINEALTPKPVKK